MNDSASEKPKRRVQQRLGEISLFGLTQ